MIFKVLLKMMSTLQLTIIIFVCLWMVQSVSTESSDMLATLLKVTPMSSTVSYDGTAKFLCIINNPNRNLLHKLLQWICYTPVHTPTPIDCSVEITNRESQAHGNLTVTAPYVGACELVVSNIRANISCQCLLGEFKVIIRIYRESTTSSNSKNYNGLATNTPTYPSNQNNESEQLLKEQVFITTVMTIISFILIIVSLCLFCGCFAVYIVKRRSKNGSHSDPHKGRLSSNQYQSINGDDKQNGNTQNSPNDTIKRDDLDGSKQPLIVVVENEERTDEKEGDKARVRTGEQNKVPSSSINCSLNEPTNKQEITAQINSAQTVHNNKEADPKESSDSSTTQDFLIPGGFSTDMGTNSMKNFDEVLRKKSTGVETVTKVDSRITRDAIVQTDASTEGQSIPSRKSSKEPLTRACNHSCTACEASGKAEFPSDLAFNQTRFQVEESSTNKLGVKISVPNDHLQYNEYISAEENLNPHAKCQQKYAAGNSSIISQRGGRQERINTVSTMPVNLRKLPFQDIFEDTNTSVIYIPVGGPGINSEMFAQLFGLRTYSSSNSLQNSESTKILRENKKSEVNSSKRDYHHHTDEPRFDLLSKEESVIAKSLLENNPWEAGCDSTSKPNSLTGKSNPTNENSGIKEGDQESYTHTAQASDTCSLDESATQPDDPVIKTQCNVDDSAYSSVVQGDNKDVDNSCASIKSKNRTKSPKTCVSLSNLKVRENRWHSNPFP